MANTWIKPLSKAAGITAAAIYQMMKKLNRSAPYSEYDVWTQLRSRGRKCKGYRPVADAVGKPVPPIGEKLTPGSWTGGLLVNRLAKLLPGGDTVNNKVRIRNWLKKAGYKDFRRLEEKTALQVLADKGVDISKFEYATPQAPHPEVENPVQQNAPLTEEPAGSRSQLVAQYIALQARLKAAMETIEQCSAAMKEKDAKIAEHVNAKKYVRSVLLQFEKQLPDFVKRYLGGAYRDPITYPIQALDKVRED